MVSVTFEPVGKKVEDEPDTILEIARRNGVLIRSDCGGKGVCGKCKVVVIDYRGSLSDITDHERKHLIEEEISKGYRLACQARVEEGRATIFIPPESRLERRKVAGLTIEKEVELNPAVRKVYAEIQPPSIEDQLPDYDRLTRALGDFSLDLETLSEMPKLLREAEWRVTATFWNGRLIDLEKGDVSDRCYGVAVDVGSSKIICHLVDLKSGETIATGYSDNPQVAYGEDIVSRITYASKSAENRKRLQTVVVETVNQIIAELCNESGVDLGHVYEVMIVGNSVMHHLFFGIEPRFIGVSPFTPAVRRGVSFPAEDVGLRINRKGYVSSLPLVAGFVGADAVANIAITGIHKAEEISMVIDIGTNTEIVIGNREKLGVCSAPSGPAFEGAHITFGMKAISGAIDSVRIERDEVIYTTIDNAKAKGLCGTGLIDLIAELYRNGIINRNGKFVKDHSRIIVDGVPKFVVAKAEETEFGKPITVSEKDINELLMAKGAIKSGWMILSERLGIEPDKIERIYLAGSFGRHINVENAKVIGLLPDIPSEKITFAGDTAVGGAKMALKSVRVRDEMEDVVSRLNYVELSVEKNFYSVFVRAIPI